MKILKARNGIALVAVLAIMLISSLFIPLMFNLSDSSLAIAVKGTDRQRAMYFARTITEMSVASFTKIDHKSSGDNPQLTQGETAFINAIRNLSDPESANYNPYGKIETETVYMLSKTVDDEEIIEYASDETARDNFINDGYMLRGEGSCTITFDGSVNYYKVYADGTKVEFNEPTDPNDPMNKEDLVKRERIYNNLIRVLDENGEPVIENKKTVDGEYTKAVKAGTADYTLSKIQNKNVVFTAIATVNGITEEKQCIVVMKTTPSQDDWLVFGSPDLGNTGGNQVFVDPNKASAIVPISYAKGGSPLDDVQSQPLLVYSCMGNMVINPHNFLYNSPDGEGGVTPDANGRVSSGANGTNLVLGVMPGLNYGTNNDPTGNLLDGVNYDEQKDEVQYNNFVAFAASNVIRVEMPIDLLVNPCRVGGLTRPGDGSEPNASLYKIMIFQAPVIQFAGRTDMMVSFYERSDKARRMSSIILTAPENTPYTYYNDERGKTVKAGMVYFEQDCYLWIIDYGNEGIAHTVLDTQTVYRKDSDFRIVKIANAGDVYYFNAEVPSKDKDTGKEEKVGLSLASYYIETKYANQLTSESTNFWNEMRNELVASYLNQQEKMYVEDDFIKIGNVREMASVVEVPPVDDYYVVWTK